MPFAPYPVYHCVVIVFASHATSISAAPLEVPRFVSLHTALFGNSVGSSSAKIGDMKKIVRKQIVPICFRLDKRLHVCVCVCVCVCVGFCGFQRVDKFC